MRLCTCLCTLVSFVYVLGVRPAFLYCATAATESDDKLPVVVGVVVRRRRRYRRRRPRRCRRCRRRRRRCRRRHARVQ